MGIYTENIREKEKNNRLLEQYADAALRTDTSMRHINTEVSDAQNALMFILDRFGVTAPARYGYRSVEALLDSVLDPLGMMYRSSSSLAEAAADHTAYILAFRSDGHAVALYPSWKGYRWYCPFDSKRGLATKEYCRHLKEKCYVLNRPIREFKSVIVTFIYNVLKYLTVYDVFHLVLATMLSVGLGLIIPYFSKWVYNVYLKDPNTDLFMLRVMFALFLTVNLARGIIGLIKSRILTLLKNRVSIKFQAAVMARILHLPRSFFADNSSGKVSRKISNCNRLSGMIINIFLDILLNFSFSGVYLVQMHSLSEKLFMPALIFIAVRILISIIVAIGNAYLEREVIEVEMDNNSFFYSVIRGIQKVKGKGAEKAVYAKWADMYRTLLHHQYNKPFLLKYHNAILSAISTAATITLLGVTFYAGITREEYMVFSSSYTMVISVAETLITVMNQILRIRTLSENVEQIFRRNKDQSKMLDYVSHINGSVRVEDLHFAYEGDSRGCLRGVSLDVQPGEKVAIVGESGCGKSTLLKVILGMEKPDEGAVYFDDKDIAGLNQRSLRRHIGSVFQFSKLFPGTIYDNVTFGASFEASEEDVWKVLDLACIGDHIRELPLTINTEISEANSSGFSGGQRQRILLARAFLGNPKVLILDEATSALDNLTQKQVLDHIGAMKSTTVLMVAHRLSTVIGFDKIIMLEDGLIAEEGTYDELMEKNGKFAELVRKQLVEEEEKGKEKKPALKEAAA